MPWAKGQTGNPKGRPTLAAGIVAARKLKPLEPEILAAFKSLLTDEDGRVRAKGVELGFAYLYGKPCDAPQPQPANGQTLVYTPDALNAAEAMLEAPAQDGGPSSGEPASVPSDAGDRNGSP